MGQFLVKMASSMLILLLLSIHLSCTLFVFFMHFQRMLHGLNSRDLLYPVFYHLLLNTKSTVVNPGNPHFLGYGIRISVLKKNEKRGIVD